MNSHFVDGNKLKFEDCCASDLCSHQGDDRMVNIFQLMQRGLVYPSPFSRFVTFWAKPGAVITREMICDLVTSTRQEIHQNFGSRNSTAIVGVSFDLFDQWCAEHSMSRPSGMAYLYPTEVSAANGATRQTSNVFQRSAGSFQDSGGTLWIHIKSDDESHCAGVYDYIATQLEELVERAYFEDCNSRQTLDSDNGKGLGCRFAENLNNPADPITVAVSMPAPPIS